MCIRDREAGLRHILIGLESGREEALQRLNKKTTVEQNEKALTILRSYGIEPNVGFIMFEPDSSVEDLRINFEFLKRNHLLDNLDITVNVLYHHQIILQGTESFRQLQAEGRLHITPYSAYEGHTPYQRLEVEAFAGCMRDITNHIFSCMQGIWSGRNQETKDAKERYHQVNSLLVQCFETLLEHLEKGFTLTVENNDIVAGTKQKIATILSFT